MFVCPKAIIKEVEKTVESVCSSLAEMYPNSNLSVTRDISEVAEKEIIIGKANREGQSEFYASIPKNCFVIEVTDKCVRIGGDGPDLLVKAIKYFEESYMKPEKEGNISFEIGKYVSEPHEAKLSDVLNKTDKFATQTEIVKRVAQIDGKRIMQGGCTDGKYLYVCMTNTGDVTTAYIHKIDLETMSTVKVSEALATDHSNDMTYVPETNELFVNHCYENVRRNTVVDAETLEVKRYHDFPVYNSFISYNEKRDVFVYGAYKYFRILDRKTLMLPEGYKEEYPLRVVPYTSQGCCTDDEYIYFVYSDENVIRVYDYDGKFVTEIKMDISSIEPENMSIVGDTIYIGCNNANWTGGIIYKGKIVKEPSSEN